MKYTSLFNKTYVLLLVGFLVGLFVIIFQLRNMLIIVQLLGIVLYCIFGIIMAIIGVKIMKD